jgi:hypothetical protein
MCNTNMRCLPMAVLQQRGVAGGGGCGGCGGCGAWCVVRGAVSEWLRFAGVSRIFFLLCCGAVPLERPKVK